jgi:hypothetical protein
VTLFSFLRGLSFANSAAFAALLWVSLSSGYEAQTTVLGWTHGLMWIALSLLSLVAVRRRVMPFWLAVVVVVVGGVGPFAGTAGFVVETRRRQRLAA